MAKQSINLERIFAVKNSNIAKLLLHYFGSNDYYAMSRSIAGEISYQPIKQKLTEEIMQSHLNGEIVLGSYHLNAVDNTVNWLGWDIDSDDLATAREYAKKIIYRLADIPHCVEFSGSKGYHILIFLSQPMAAEKAKQITEFVRDSQGLPKTGKSHIECYPKQTILTKSNPMGNLLKIPLGLHPRTHNKSRFVDPTNGWENGNEIAPENVLTSTVEPAELNQLLHEEGDVQQQLIELLCPCWSEGERHNVALYLAGYLAHLGWGMQDASDLIKGIAIAAGDSDVRNRILAVEDTFRAIASGKTVKGFSGLNELLPGATIRMLAELATKVITPTFVKQIDSIRLAKGAVFEKIRAAANMIWINLQETGEMVKTVYDECYWYCSETHLLVELESVRWNSILHNDYGINPAEAFGRQVTEAIKLRAIQEAKIVSIQNRSLWTGEKLFINLGGETVYELNGKEIIITYNGECGFLFKTNSHLAQPITPDFNSPLDIWSVLVNDLSFNRSPDAPASPEEQAELLKAWMLAFFFQELMPTKPLLLALGVPGSGKTTAVRRILKVFESPDAEVLEIAGDKPDSLRASIAAHKLLVLDNLEKSGVRWLVDTLNRLATGANIELRQLYKTNETYVLKPACFVAMTAVSMPFSEETLFSRILPLEMQQLQNPQPEHLLQKSLLENMDKLWADLLNKLNAVVQALNENDMGTPPVSSRLADFTVFCKRIENSGCVDKDVLMHGLRSLVDRQRITLLEASPFIAVLEQWLNSTDEEVKKEHTFQELFSILEPLAKTRKLTWRWGNSAALGRHIMALAEPLKKTLYGRNKNRVRYNSKTRNRENKIYTIKTGTVLVPVFLASHYIVYSLAFFTADNSGVILCNA